MFHCYYCYATEQHYQEKLFNRILVVEDIRANKVFKHNKDAYIIYLLEKYKQSGALLVT